MNGRGLSKREGGEVMDTLKRNDLSKFPKIDPELAREVSENYIRARNAVVEAAEHYWEHRSAIVNALPCQSLGVEEVTI